MNTAADSVAAVLASVDDKPASYLGAARRLAALERKDPLTPTPVVVLSSFTFDLVVPYLVVEGARRGLDFDVTVTPFGQLEQQALDPASAVYTHKPRLIVIATRVEELAPVLADRFLSLSSERLEAEIAGYVERVSGLVRTLRARSTAHVVVCNQAPLRRLVAGLADAGIEPSQQFAVAQLNRRLAQAIAAVPDVSVLDVSRIASEVGLAQWYDLKLAVLARSPISGVGQLALGRKLARHARAISRPPCKCLVLDLDNTLWGGVLGEDGIGGIALGEEHPGSIFKAFQRAVLGYRDRGVLLAIASKNNAADVEELFAKHADMVVRREDFAANQIHWNDKATSLRAIAKELDIGVDSLAFFDDNPVERAWVREQLPEVTVIEVPKEPLRYLDALDESGAFDQLAITAEDRQRAGQYQVEAQRTQLENTAASLEDFLRALEVKVTVGSIDGATLPRAVQLIGKTNQFNLTTRRHTAADLGAMLGRPGAIGLWMRVADKFGDSGLVGVAIAIPGEPATYLLDTFLLSCRVLGRHAERALLYSIARRASSAGAGALLGEFIPTKKNAVAARFFADAGFGALERRPNWWRLELGSGLRPPELVELFEEP